MTMSNRTTAKTTVQDCDCAAMARAALFPKQINRDGTHTTIFPAVSALSIIRQNIIQANPNQAESSLFPRRVVVVKEIGHENTTLKWNGQPDIDEKTASFDVIPNILSVQCMACAGLNEISKTTKSFVEKSTCDNTNENKIVLCTDRLLQGDYKPSAGTASPTSLSLSDMPPRSYAAVEETLAHQVTLVGTQLNYNTVGQRTNDFAPNKSSSCQEMAVAEIQAAKAAECFYEKSDKEVKRGSGLPLGYSLLPAFLQRNFMHKCIQSVATRNVSQEYGKEEGSKCVKEAMNSAK